MVEETGQDNQEAKLSAEITEGEIVRSRNLKSYKYALLFEDGVLRSRTILNFGAGGSNLGKELQEKDSNSIVVDLDLLNNPGKDYSFRQDPLRFIAALPIRFYLEHFKPNKDWRKKIIEVKRKIGDIAERKFVQGDGRNLPFADRTFDTALSLWTTYQIPIDDREQVFRELMRVADTIHLGPVFGEDYRILCKLALEKGFSIVLSQPFPVSDLLLLEPERPNVVRTSADYEKYMRINDRSLAYGGESALNQKPKREKIAPRDGYATGGTCLILKRRTPEYLEAMKSL